ncbi:ATP-binding protein [Halorussus marinus]|uniref:ATP-binding protein n=1 Tax=Halorussus marinus TaxID=2505976 RepID=UPI001B2FEC0E|nr:DUF87 domain-containing protein [Halorussus marinus]
MNSTETITVGEDGFTLPVVDVLTGRGFITGKSGSGKSNSASVVAEQLLDDGYPLLVVDTDGEYYGLKEEYEMLHVGADEECDLQVGPEHAEKLASLALEENVPIILDVSGYLNESDASDLIRDTAHQLFAKEKKLKKPFLMLVEEVHEYIPQSGGLDETGQMLVKIGKRGRKHGLGMVGISQRPADVKKDFITQADWLVWHRLTWENDLKTVRRVLGNDIADDVPDLADGEAFVMADWETDIERVQWQRKQTFDAGATPGLDDFERPELKSVSGDLVDELEEISQREDRRQDRISQLEDRVDELQAEKAELEEELDQARDMQQMAEQFTEAMTSTGGSSESTETIQAEVAEIKQEKNERIRELESELEDVRDENEEYREQVEALRDELESRPEISERAVEAVDVLADEFGVGTSDNDALKRKLETARERIEELESEQSAPDPDVLEHPSVDRYISRMQNELADLDEYEADMLQWFKYNGPGSVEDAYWAAGGSRKSSQKRKKMKTLQQKDLVEQVQRGEYRYALPEAVRDWFDGNDAVAEDDVEAIVLEIESVLEGADA